MKTYRESLPERIRIAYDFANEKHKGQKRKYSNENYITHPVQVMEILRKLTDDEDVLCAALLHDVLEDTDTTRESIIKWFGMRVLSIVEEVTDPMNIKTKEGLMVKLADTLHNISDRPGTDHYVKKKIERHFKNGV